MTLGLQCFIAGIGLIQRPGVRRFVILPLLINVVIFGVASWMLWLYAFDWLSNLLPSWLGWLVNILMPLFTISLLTVVYFSFTLLANVIAAPFYSHLANSVEAILKGEEIPEVESSSIFKEIMLTMGSELRKITYYLLRALPLLILTIIPGINVIALPLWLLFSAWFLAFEYSGYALENHKILFQQQRLLLSEDRVSAISFGGLSLLATTTPFVNLIAPAVAVAGATKLMYEKGKLN